jgi:GTPase-associated protein 1, N-terminal domain type 2/GTPase-associated protein 1, middle domain
MTGGAFDRLLYTDCRAGTGRGPGAGFQVQAQSAGVDAAQSKMALGWLLYDAPSAWIVQRRAVEDFPLGFAHAAEAGYGTAQSRYVGTEATGGRQGNHLADCLLTRDQDLYGPTRPAQLWRSALWRAQAWDSTDCPPFTDTPPLGPLTVDAVAEWLQARPDRAQVLARLLSVLEDPAGRRVVIAASEPGEAMTWIAAATLLLPARAALDVSFKVFCSNPVRAAQRIVAVLKELNPQTAPGRADSAFVLDAEECRSDDAEVSQRARFWVDKLARSDDPYDVIDAVELAASLAAGTGRDETDAMVTAWAATSPDSSLADPPALSRWLLGAGPKLQQEHGALVARRILAASPGTEALRWIDDTVARGLISIDPVEVRGHLLTAEIAEVRAGAAPPAGPLPPIAVDADARRDADSDLSSAILLGSDQEVDRLLRLARRHRIEPQLAPLLQRLRGFALSWVDNRTPGYSPGDWALRAEILDLAKDELQVRLAEWGLQKMMGTLARLSPHFADLRGDPADLLDCHFEVAAIRALPSAQRRSRLSELIDRAWRSPRSAEAVAGVQLALVQWKALGPAEARLILMALPETVAVAPDVVEILDNELRRAVDRPTAAMLDVLDVLARRNLAPPGRQFLRLLSANREVMGFIDATRSGEFQHVDHARQWVQRLGQADPAVTRARLSRLLRACLEFPEPGLGAAVLGVLRSSQPRMFVDLWSRELGGAQGIRAAVWAVYWAADRRLPENLIAHIEDMIRDFGSVLSPADREKWLHDVLESLGSEQAKALAELVSVEAPRRHLGHLGRLGRNRGKDAG